MMERKEDIMGEHEKRIRGKRDAGTGKLKREKKRKR
jgi:hypothetical protein